MTTKGKTEIKTENLSYGVLGLYPSEIKNLISIDRIDNRTVSVKLAYGKNGHRKERKIRVDGDFDIENMTKYIEYLKNFKEETITEKIKEDFNATPTELRHLFATDQTMKYGRLNEASKEGMGHNSVKNMAYYVDPIQIADMFGVDQALKLINATEHKFLFGMIRLAIRLELEKTLGDLT